MATGTGLPQALDPEWVRARAAVRASMHACPCMHARGHGRQVHTECSVHGSASARALPHARAACAFMLPAPHSPQVASNFVRQFYTVLLNHPQFMSRFYKESSSLTINDMLQPRTLVGSGLQVRAAVWAGWGRPGGLPGWAWCVAGPHTSRRLARKREKAWDSCGGCVHWRLPLACVHGLAGGCSVVVAVVQAPGCATCATAPCMQAGGAQERGRAPAVDV